MIPTFNPFINGDNWTIFKNVEQQLESSHTTLKSKLPHKVTTYIELCKHFGRRDEQVDKSGSFHWTLILPSLSLNCWAQLRELVALCQHTTLYLNSQNLTWITNFHSRIL